MRAEIVQNLLQALGILGLAGILSVIAHKAASDVSALAYQYSGGEFWLRLGRYVIANLSG